MTREVAYTPLSYGPGTPDRGAVQCWSDPPAMRVTTSDSVIVYEQGIFARITTSHPFDRVSVWVRLIVPQTTVPTVEWELRTSVIPAGSVTVATVAKALNPTATDAFLFQVSGVVGTSFWLYARTTDGPLSVARAALTLLFDESNCCELEVVS